MPVQTSLQNIERLGSLATRSRFGRVVLLLVAVASFVIGLTYHILAMQRGTPSPVLIEIVQNVSTLVGFLALWLLFAKRFQSRQSSPARIFWTVLIFGILFIAAASLTTSVFRGDAPELIDIFQAESEFNNGIPRVLTTIIRSSLLSILGVFFSLYVLFRIRELVLFKRTKTSQRNWFFLTVAMAVFAASFLFKSPEDESLNLIQTIALLPAVGLMVINSLRASWIVFFNFKQKLISISLSLLVLFFLLISLGLTNIPAPSPYLSDMFVYMRFYNYPLCMFVLLTICFGILYCTASLLLLLFHLPTTGDFQRREHERAVMHALTELVNQAFDSEKLYSKIASSPVEAGSAESAWLAVADVQSGSLKPQLVASSKIDSSRVDRIVDSTALYDEASSLGSSVLIGDALTDHRLDVHAGDGFGSLLAVPLITRDEVLGVLFVTKDVTHGFEQDDIDSIQIYAAQAAIAMDNARLFAERLEKERLTRELDIAREVQRKLLPQTLPSLHGVTIAASNVSAERVGGDYYDFLQLDEERLSIIIGDVSGKGASAAFYMAEMQGIFQSTSRLAPRPVEFLKHANAALSGSLEKNVFISVIYGLLDLEKEEFIIGRAGHCPAATINLNGEAKYLRPSGIGLGLDRGALFDKALQEERIPLQPGDVFVLYTDGIIESRNSDGEEYGYDRLLHALQSYRYEDATGIHSALLKDLNSFLGQESYDDDMTLVVIKWHGIPLSTPSKNDKKAVSLSVPAESSN